MPLAALHYSFVPLHLTRASYRSSRGALPPTHRRPRARMQGNACTSLSLLLHYAVDWQGESSPPSPLLVNGLHASYFELVRFSPTVSTSEISNSPEDDATQIPMSQMSGSTPPAHDGTGLHQSENDC
uniref:Uncharacterized protein n=1 Tax=Sphaerodactylus townsendi TaxID=933632 RepID=A0ACB8FQV9_9SAUR